MSSLVLEHFLFSPLGPFAFLPPDFLDPLLLLAFFSKDRGFDLVGKNAPGQKPVDGLRPFPLALDLDAGGQMFQINAGRDLIHMLPALALGTDKFFDEVVFPNAKALHFVAQGFFFLWAHAKDRHGIKVIYFVDKVKDLARVLSPASPIVLIEKFGEAHGRLRLWDFKAAWESPLGPP
jgi:hypothetical protein